MSKEKISELEDRLTETSQTEIQKEKLKERQQTEHPETKGPFQKLNINTTLQKRENRAEQILELIIVKSYLRLADIWSFPKCPYLSR